VYYHRKEHKFTTSTIQLRSILLLRLLVLRTMDEPRTKKRVKAEDFCSCCKMWFYSLFHVPSFSDYCCRYQNHTSHFFFLLSIHASHLNIHQWRVQLNSLCVHVFFWYWLLASCNYFIVQGSLFWDYSFHTMISRIKLDNTHSKFDDFGLSHSTSHQCCFQNLIILNSDAPP